MITDDEEVRVKAVQLLQNTIISEVRAGRGWCYRCVACNAVAKLRVDLKHYDDCALEQVLNELCR